LWQSVLGTFLDPLADKVLVSFLSLPLAYQGQYADVNDDHADHDIMILMVTVMVMKMYC
jgi:phosphatidylglycerophosphate synthase